MVYTYGIIILLLWIIDIFGVGGWLGLYSDPFRDWDPLVVILFR